MIRVLSKLALLVALAGTAAAQEPLSVAEVGTILKCVRHDRLNLLGSEFLRGRIRVRYVWARDHSQPHPNRDNVLFFAFRTDNGRLGRIMEFVPEGKRPERHFTMSNDANFDGQSWRITSDPLGGVGTHELFPAQLRRLQQRSTERRYSLASIGATEGTCDSYVEPALSR